MVGVAELVLALSLVIGSVVAQPSPGTNPFVPSGVAPSCGTEFNFEVTDFSTDFPNAEPVVRCSGIIEAEDSGTDYPVCAVMTDIAAERACWHTGRNLDTNRNIKLAKCRAHEAVLTTLGVTMVVESDTPANGFPEVFDSKGKYDCEDECFEECYDDIFNNPTAGTVSAGTGNCGRPYNLANGDRALAAVVCFDRNECIDGLLYDCDGPCDEDCVKGKPCAANAECTNTLEAYECNCKTGFQPINTDDEYLHLATGGAGCVDIDECLTDPCPTAEDICQNTIGSYVCVCNKWKLFDNPGGGDECEEVTCPELTILNAAAQPIAEDTQAESVTVTCETGYRASNDPSNNEFSLTCRDSRWCSCIQPFCEPKPCGDPGTDTYATHPRTLGLQGMEVEYTCEDGYGIGGVDGADTYTKRCEDGTWVQDPAGECERVDLCDARDPCHEDADCINVPGSFICICKLGYTGDGIDCDKITCGALPDMDNAPAPVQEDEYWEYTCNAGYAIDHAFYNYEYNFDPVPTQYWARRKFRVYCALSGHWEPQPIPHCHRISCGDPGICLNSKRSGSRFLYEDSVTYTCQPGYKSNAVNEPTLFTATCQADGTWTTIYQCLEVDECLNGSPCGDDIHYCINTPGSYRCSCAPGFRPSPSGTACVAHPSSYPYIDWRDAPCDFYNILNLCDRGNCQVDAGGNAQCVCEDGYYGSFCTLRNTWRAFEILAVLGVVLSGLCFLCFIFTLCCLCGPFMGAARRRVPPPANNAVYGIPTRINRPTYPPFKAF